MSVCGWRGGSPAPPSIGRPSPIMGSFLMSRRPSSLWTTRANGNRSISMHLSRSRGGNRLPRIEELPAGPRFPDALQVWNAIRPFSFQQRLEVVGTRHIFVPLPIILPPASRHEGDPFRVSLRRYSIVAPAQQKLAARRWRAFRLRTIP